MGGNGHYKGRCPKCQERLQFTFDGYVCPRGDYSEPFSWGRPLKKQKKAKKLVDHQP